MFRREEITMNQTPTQTATIPTSNTTDSGLSSNAGTTSLSNGTGQKNAESADKKRAGDSAQRARVATATFGEIVALLSFSPVYKHMSLADLEWLIIPALATNQVTTVRGKLKDKNDLTVPLGLALWAHVSVEVDKKLEAQQQQRIPFRLAPQDWKNGDIPWLLTVLAPKEVEQALVNKLEETVFKDKTYKRFALGTSGTVSSNQGKGSEENPELATTQEAS
jgi:hemolysin-activating ACP:hemolysin acyltransferase